MCVQVLKVSELSADAELVKLSALVDPLAARELTKRSCFEVHGTSIAASRLATPSGMHPADVSLLADRLTTARPYPLHLNQVFHLLHFQISSVSIFLRNYKVLQV